MIIQLFITSLAGKLKLNVPAQLLSMKHTAITVCLSVAKMGAQVKECANKCSFSQHKYTGTLVEPTSTGISSKHASEI